MSLKPVSTQPPREIEQRDIAYAAIALARRAERAGLTISAYLFELAALEAGTEIAIRRMKPAEIDPNP